MEKEKINLLVLEDDPFYQTSLTYMLKDSNYHISAIFDNKESIDAFLTMNSIDLLICDIIIQGEFVNKEWINKIRMKQIPIICITATLEESIYHNLKDLIYGYLVKPFHKITLHSAIKNGFEQFRKDKLYDFIDQKYLFIRKKGSILEKFNFSEIVYLESEGNYCYIYTKNKKLIEKISLTKILKEKLDNRFIRVHHKFAINTEYLVMIGPHEVILNSETRIPLSSTFRSNIKDFTLIDL